MSNESITLCKLQEHFIKMHPDNIGDSLDSLTEKRNKFQIKFPKLNPIAQKSIIEGSYRLAYLISKNKAPYAIGEITVKSCSPRKSKANEHLNHANKQMTQIPMTESMIKSRISDMASDILTQLMEDLYQSTLPFGLQLHIHVDEAQCSYILAYVRYTTDKCIKEDFLFCEPLPGNAKVSDVYKMINELFAKYNMDWRNKIGFLCSDNTPSMLDFGAFVQMEAPHVEIVHCFIHRHTLASKHLTPRMKSVIKTAIKAINFIRSRDLNHWIYKALCREVGAPLGAHIYHTEVRWLKYGKVFTRFMELRNEIADYLKECNNRMHEQIKTENFIGYFAYLADVFHHMADLRTSIQGSKLTVIDATEKIDSILQKLSLWKERVSSDNYENFPHLVCALYSGSVSIETVKYWIQGDILLHFENLMQGFHKHVFKHVNERDSNWIKNPFSFQFETLKDDDLQKADLVHLQSNDIARKVFADKSLDEFWCLQKKSYPFLSHKAILGMLPFATTYLSANGYNWFSNKMQNDKYRFQTNDDIRLTLSKTAPRIPLLAEKRQKMFVSNERH